jgi:hypothetical protein
MPGFNYLGFYQKITLAVGEWRDEDQRSLLMWWNRCVLTFTLRPPLTAMWKHDPLTSSWRSSRDTAQRHSGARFRSRTDDSTSDRRDRCSPLRFGKVSLLFVARNCTLVYAMDSTGFCVVIRNNCEFEREFFEVVCQFHGVLSRFI